MRGALATALLAAALLAAAPAAAQQRPFEDAVAAYDRGDFAEAIRIWTPLARRGDVAAQFNLGLMYEKGRGVPADADRAAQWYLSAAESGHAKSAFNLGVLHSRGVLGPERNLDEAGRWLGAAAEKGIPQAQYLFALLLADRDYKAMNPNLADQWMRRAADAGYAPARQHLATQTAGAPPA
ncbi:MAG: sel1 repeat family protein, partial [Alphaproteobacteria bacterium]|nr:sel1 repeat family protein [Alphaproteobacteria bacterium]